MAYGLPAFLGLLNIVFNMKGRVLSMLIRRYTSNLVLLLLAYVLILLQSW